MQARHMLMGLLPDLPGWHVYQDTAPMGASPPWVVVQVAEDVGLMNEALQVTTRRARLDVRIVSDNADSIALLADKLHARLDGLYPGKPFSRLIPDADSGVFPSELSSDMSNHPFLMRVLRWDVAW